MESTRTMNVETAVKVIYKFNAGIYNRTKLIDNEIDKLENKKVKLKAQARKEKAELLTRVCKKLGVQESSIKKIMK